MEDVILDLCCGRIEAIIIPGPGKFCNFLGTEKEYVISVECIRMSLRAKDLAGKIVCCGVGSIVAIQSFLNICVATGLAPNTGTPLPFVSYGLTSLVSLFIGMGLVMNVGLQSSAYNKELKKKEIDKKEEYL